MHGFLSVPGPPFDFLSLQCLHVPQSLFMHALHAPHLLFLGVDFFFAGVDFFIFLLVVF